MDTFSVAERSRIMSQVKSKGNRSTEVRLASELRLKGLHGWRRNSEMFGKPDFIYPRQRIALFVDGCFWHGCKKHCRVPASNRVYWIEKIEKNKRRDREVNKVLRDKGWKVIRIWEHEIKTGGMQRKLSQIRSVLQNPL